MFNKVTIVGRVGGEPEMKYTNSGTALTTFSVATSKYSSKQIKGWKEAGQGYALTTWWRVTCWGDRAQYAYDRVAKGSVVLVEGEIGGDAENGEQSPHVWQDTSGCRSSYDLTALNVTVISDRKQKEESQEQETLIF